MPNLTLIVNLTLTVTLALTRCLSLALTFTLTVTLPLARRSCASCTISQISQVVMCLLHHPLALSLVMPMNVYYPWLPAYHRLGLGLGLGLGQA